MSDAPWFRFFPSDWLAGTRGMTAAETGVYITLIAMMYDTGAPLKDDDGRLARRCGTTPAAFGKTLDALITEGKITRRPDGLWNGRVGKEVEARAEITNRSRVAAKQRWQKDEQNQGSSDADALPEHSSGNAYQKPEARELTGSTEANASSEPRTKPARGRLSYPDDFEKFWKAYPVDQNMSKREALTAWSRLSDDDRKAAVASLPAYRSYCERTADYRPLHACRYLSKRRFEGHLGAAAAAPTVRLVVDDKTWADRLAYGRAKRVWSTKDWGPMPSLPGCQVPAHLLAPGDGEGWAEYQGKSAA